MNLSIDTTTEVNQWNCEPHTLLSVFQSKDKFVLYRESTVTATSFSVLFDTLILFPIFNMLFFGGPILGVIVLILFIWSAIFSLPDGVFQATVSPPALALGYVASLIFVLKKYTPLRDFKDKKKYVSTKEVYFDFSNNVLIVEEVFKHFPAKCKKNEIKLKGVELVINKHYASYVDDDYTDFMSLKMRVSKLPQSSWASHKIGMYALCTINFNRSIDGSEQKCLRDIENITAAFKQRTL